MAASTARRALPKASDILRRRQAITYPLMSVPGGDHDRSSELYLTVHLIRRSFRYPTPASCTLEHPYPLQSNRFFIQDLCPYRKSQPNDD